MFKNQQQAESSHNIDSTSDGSGNIIFSVGEKRIITNVYRYVEKTWPAAYWSITECIGKTADITGFPKASISNVIMEYIDELLPYEVMVPEDAVTLKYGDANLAAIRRKIFQFFNENGHGIPTPENLLREVNADPKLPNLGMEDFLCILEHFHYKHVTYLNVKNGVENRHETFTIPVI